VRTATDIRKGQILVVENDLWVVLDYTHLTPGNKRGYVQVTMKNLQSGRKDNRRFRSTDKIDKAFIETKPLQYLYRDNAGLHFMDTETYDQMPLDLELAGDAVNYLKEGAIVKVSFHEDNAVGIDLPASVVLEVTDTLPGAKGDTVSNVFKSATLETGIEVKVPNYVTTGEQVKVDTRTGEFLERV
jgi:elongation factor P